jgi:microcompartment protein CcmL/EutN
MVHSLKGWINILSAVSAIAAALLWLKSARVEIWADGQTAPQQGNLVILKDGRKFDVTGTAREQSKWSAYAAYAAAVAAALQALAVFMRD